MEYLFLWDKLRSIQDSKIIKSTYLWLVIVPVTAKLFSKIENEIQLNINDKIYTFDLVLPFSWQIFFFSALFFVLGNVLFIVFSPRIIKEYKDFGHFLQIGGNDSDLDEFKDKVLRQKDSARTPLSDVFRDGTGLSKEEKSRNKFWDIYKYFNSTNSLMRYATSLAYLVGFLLFLCVAFANIVWVLKQITIF